MVQNKSWNFWPGTTAVAAVKPAWQAEHPDDLRVPAKKSAALAKGQRAALPGSMRSTLVRMHIQSAGVTTCSTCSVIFSLAS